MEGARENVASEQEEPRGHMEGCDVVRRPEECKSLCIEHNREPRKGVLCTSPTEGTRYLSIGPISGVGVGQYSVSISSIAVSTPQYRGDPSIRRRTFQSK